MAEGLLPVLHDIPLVGGDDEGPALLDHHAGDGQILLFQHRAGIHHQHHDMGELNSPAGVFAGKMFQPLGHT